MTSLKNIDLNSNKLIGSIPKTICNLMYMVAFIGYNNSLNGTLPDCMDKMISLMNLELSWNQITGAIPNSLCSMPRLSELFLNDNSMDGTYPNCINNLTNLIVLCIGNNFISGTINNSWGPKLQIVAIYNNSLEGELPILPWYTHWFLVQNNKFTGNLSKLFGNINNMTNLEVVAINNNMFYEENAGSLLRDILLSPKIQTLSISHNEISGDFPEFEHLMIQTTLKQFVANNIDLTG
eukprot:389243_1